MSRLDDIKEELRDSGQVVCEDTIDWLARKLHHHEKLRDMPNTIQKKIKAQMKGRRNAS
jgi:hypothetical protein